ncbi:MAG: DNA polymerase III subunit delta' [Lachnospiraceae bacterium]|nr:DNA polymerase III subunit delta' [Lachnospiraceae bacterium]
MPDFRDVVGHEQVIEHLQNAIRMKKVSHAYLLEGENGCGKNLLANIFAAALQCEKEGANPCGVCKSCMQMASGNQPDVIRVTHEKSGIGVDDIRTQVNADIYVKPYASRYKIYMIDEAEKMNEQAQNALLKTIEEPPEYAVLILLCSNRNKLLPTILSRCVTLTLRAVPKDAIQKYLMEKCQIPDYRAGLAAEFAGGNLGRAVRYASSEEFGARKDELIHILKYLEDCTMAELMDAVKHLAENKASIDDELDLMMLWYRDVLLFKATKDVNQVLFRDEVAAIRRQAGLYSFGHLEAIVEAIQKARVRLNANVNFEVAMELMLLTIKESESEYD